MSRASQHSRERSFTTRDEKQRIDSGTIKIRLGTDSQLPFGYCPLSISPIDDPVVSPSGHIYSREAILQYIVNRMQEIKEQHVLYEKQIEEKRRNENSLKQVEILKESTKFIETNDGVANVVKRKATEAELQNNHLNERKKKIDEKDKDEKMDELKRVNYWITQFTPMADDAEIKEPLKRPLSPFSGKPLRTKDLIPVELKREAANDNSGTVRFICPVSKKTITNQKCILIKNTGTLMLESVAQELAYPSLIDPITSKKFTKKDVLDIVPAASAYAASGNVEASKYRPTIK